MHTEKYKLLKLSHIAPSTISVLFYAHLETSSGTISVLTFPKLFWIHRKSNVLFF